MSQLQFNILNKKQSDLFDKLKVFKKEAVLAGGTALSLQIGHRHSFDFDLFFNRKIGLKDTSKLKRCVRVKRIGLQTERQIDIITANDILINLVFFPFKPMFKKIRTFSLPLFAVKDIALNKAFAIGRRATWRDYIDIFFLLKDNHIALKEILKLAPKKFGPEFNERIFLEQLTYFKDIEVTKISFIKKNFSADEVKKFLVTEVKKHKKDIFAA